MQVDQLTADMRQPSASYSLTIRVELSSRPGTLGRVLSAIGGAGGDVDAVDLVRVTSSSVIRDITVAASGEEHGQAIASRVETLDGVHVMHDDQHGTAVVVLAALTNALKLVNKAIEDMKIVLVGVGAAGTAITRMMVEAGARRVISCDLDGAIYAGRPVGMDRYKVALAAVTNPEREQGSVHSVIRGADVFIGVSGPGAITAADVASMGADPVVFALANPQPEVAPEAIAGIARVVATGRSDYPNQINNSLVFPGIFRGALEVEATDINEAMKLAAARAIAALIGPDELNEEYIIPGMFDARVADAVARATREAAWSSGAARKPRPADADS